MNLISVIVPCWNEEETIPIYYEHMCPVMDAIDADCELIFVDDGSQDATLSEMKKLSEKDARCQYLSFSRRCMRWSKAESVTASPPDAPIEPGSR